MRWSRPDTPEWMQWSACRDTWADVFYPEEGQPSDLAKRICALCPVERECLEFALLTREPHGVWGGKSERERRVLLRNGWGLTG